MNLKKNGKYTEESARLRIKRAGGIVQGKSIAIENAGLKLLGAIDFLCNYCGYHRKRTA